MQLAFGPFRLDPSSQSLWRDDELVPLTRKAFGVLTLPGRAPWRPGREGGDPGAGLARRRGRRGGAQGLRARDPPRARRRPAGAALHRHRAPPRLPLHRAGVAGRAGDPGRPDASAGVVGELGAAALARPGVDRGTRRTARRAARRVRGGARRASPGDLRHRRGRHRQDHAGRRASCEQRRRRPRRVDRARPVSAAARYGAGEAYLPLLEAIERRRAGVRAAQRWSRELRAPRADLARCRCRR